MSGNDHDFLRPRALGAFLVWMLLNICLSFTNKYLFLYKNYTFPLFIIILGTLATLIGSVALLLLGVEHLHWTRCKKHWRMLFALAVIHGIDVGLENFSLVYISISVNQIIKATVPAMTLVLSFLLEGKRYSLALQFSTALTVVGAILAVLKNPQVDQDGAVGVVAACLSAAAAAVSTVLMGVLLQRAKIGAVAIGAVTSLPSALVLVPAFLAWELPRLRAGGRVMGVQKAPYRGVVPWLGLMCVLALMYNLSRLYLIKFTAAHYSVIAGSVKVGVIVVASMLVFHDHGSFTARNWAGTGLSLVGFFSYSYHKFHEAKAAAEARTLAHAKNVGLDEIELELLDTLPD